MEVTVHSGTLAQTNENPICFVAWAGAFHAATLLKDQCVVGISCEVADCSQITTPGPTMAAQKPLIICKRPVLCMYCQVIAEA